MRGPRRRYGGGSGGNFGLMLLLFQLAGFVQFLSSHNEFLPTTLVLLGINVLAFIRPQVGGMRSLRFARSFHWPSVSESCISAKNVWHYGQWERLFLAPFIHADSWHLYYNMISFMWKARTLEKRYGSLYFAYIIAVFTLLTSGVYLILNVHLAEYFDWSYYNRCAVGFSGVIFAVKVLTTHLQPNHMSYIFGIGIPSKLAVWAELILISVLNPNASFIGHLAGILVGLAFVSGPLKMIMDIPWGIVTSGISGANIGIGRQSYNYAARPSGQRRNDSNQQDSDLQEGIRRSLNDYERPPPYNPDYDDDEDDDNGSPSSSRSTGTGHSEERLRNARLRRFVQQQ